MIPTQDISIQAGRVSMDQALSGSARRTQHGVALVEALLVAPFLLVTALVLLQLMLLWKDRTAFRAALHTAARAGAVDYASPASIEDGFVRGLIVLNGGVKSLADYPLAYLRAKTDWTAGRIKAWAGLAIVSPTRRSFSDWGQAIWDAHGRPTGTGVEIPAQVLTGNQIAPQQGGSIGALGLSVGGNSGQTLADAQMLKLHGFYGLRMNVPIAGALIAAVMKSWYGCGLPTEPSYGLWRLGRSTWNLPTSTSVRMCAGLFNVGGDGPRWVVEHDDSVRAMTPIRLSAWIQEGEAPTPASQETRVRPASGSFENIDVQATKRTRTTPAVQ